MKKITIMIKQINKSLVIIGGVAICMVAYACKKSFLNREPIGQISGATLNNRAGVNGLLIGAYSMLDGTGINDWLIDAVNTSVWNAWAGSCAADDAHKGGGFGSQPERGELEGKYYTSENAILYQRWKHYYAAIQRCNEAIRALNTVPDGEFSEAEALQVRTEARFLRGVYHLMAAQMWRNIPYIDETISFAANNYKVSNMPSDVAWTKIIEDFQFAIDNLPPTQTDIGRPNSWAAKAFLAKVYMQENRLADAKPLLDDVIANGVTTNGLKYDLQPEFSQLFRAKYENRSESVFAVQMSVNDGGDGRNGNQGEWVNYPSTFGGWGNQPSFSLANAYKTENGLPMLDNFNDVDLKNDMAVKPTDPFTPSTAALDPRLDWTIARRGVPFHDLRLGSDAPNPEGGPYRGKKWVIWNEDVGGIGSESMDGWQQAGGMNYNMIRFAEVLLWAAECEVEIGDLQKAEDLVNRVRTRAANPDGFLKKYVDDADPSKGFTNTPAANYDIKLYSGGNSFAAKGKDYARKAVRFERRLELALEGQRFFDLQRYDLAQPGYMADLLNSYMQQELAKFNSYLPAPQTYNIFVGANFIKGRHEIYAIPRLEIQRSAESSGPTLTQNPGHDN